MLKKLCIVLFCVLSQFSLSAQGYQVGKIEKSTQVLKINGAEYYSHKVMPRQTLYSLAKEYGVTVDEITACNTIVKEKGLQAGTTVIIPVKTAPVAAETSDIEPKEVAAAPSHSVSIPFTEYVVRWYDTFSEIAERYKVPKDVLMKFNNLSSEKLKSRMVLKIPTRGEDFMKIRQGAQAEESKETESSRSVAKADTASGGKSVRKGLTFKGLLSTISHKKEVNAVLLLPFNLTAEGTPDSLGVYPKSATEYKDFYSGALIACRNAGLSGITVNLDVYDISAGGTEIEEIQFAGKNVVIGPIHYGDIKRTLDVLPEDIALVSPLSRNIDTLAVAYPNFISVPPHVNHQELIDWMVVNMNFSDNVVVLSETGKVDSLLNAKMREAHIDYQVFSYELLNNKDIEVEMANVFTTSRRNVVYIDSSNNAFVADAVRNLHILATFKEYAFPIVLYADGAVVNLPGSEIDNFHSTNLHCLAGYYIDYNQPQVVDFIADYRALFLTEPSRFAFQGYDTVSYFISLIAEYGPSWSYFLNENRCRRLFQSDFKFKKVPGGGYVNVGSRKIEYGRDYNVDLLPL